MHLGSCGVSLDRPNQKNYEPSKDDGSPDDHYYTLAGMWDKTEMECLDFCMKNKITKDVAWYIKQRETEKFVRYTGKVFTMGQYQVFNPLNGTHKFCETEAEAKQELANITQALYNTYKPTVCREMTNEHGHATWIAEEMQNAVIIAPNI